MSEPENFLTRWSRRKLDAEEQAAPVAAEAAPPKPAEEVEVPGAAENRTAAPPEPAFDPASLPPLDSIGAETDIAAFLKKGVPGDLRLAALRRAWVTDPAIRDFKGLAENDWDFTVPNETMGFGEIDSSLDMKKMLADVFGDKARADAPAAELPPVAEPQPTPAPHELSAPANRVALNSADDSSRDETAANEEEVVHRNNNIASQPDNDGPDLAPRKQSRRHGGALPQ